MELGTTFPYQEIDITHLKNYAGTWNALRTSIGGTEEFIKMRWEIVVSEDEEFRTLNDEIEIIL